MPDECRRRHCSMDAKRSNATPHLFGDVTSMFRAKTYLADALPGLAAAEHAAEGATLNLQRVGALHRDRGVVFAAAVRVVNLASPFQARRLHADQDFLAGLHRIAAKVLAAFLDANVALVFFGGPDTERGGRGRRGGRGD